MMTESAWELFKIWLLLTLLALSCCGVGWWYYRQRQGIDIGDDHNVQYRYHVQAIYDQAQTMVGYELLLRSFDQSSQRWQLPQRVATFPLTQMVAQLQRLQACLKPTVKIIALNLTVAQVADFRALQFVQWSQSIIGPQRQLVLEIDAVAIHVLTPWQKWRFKRQLQRLKMSGVAISIEDIDATKRTYQSLRPLLTEVDYLKFAAGAFKKSADHWLDLTLGDWQRHAKRLGVTLVLAKVQDGTQDTLAQRLQIPYRQGYWYSAPQAPLGTL